MEEKKYHAFGYVKRLLMEISNLIFFYQQNNQTNN